MVARGPRAHVGTGWDPAVALGDDADLRSVEPGGRPRRRVGVAPELPELVAGDEELTPGIVRPRLRPGAGEQRLAVRLERLARPAHQLDSAVDAVGPPTEDARELADGSVVTGRADGGGVRDRPAEADRRHHGRRVEHPEGRRHHLARHLTHQRTPAGEVRGAVGQGDAVGRGRARREAEGRIRRVALRREVHLPDQRFDAVAQRAPVGVLVVSRPRHGMAP